MKDGVRTVDRRSLIKGAVALGTLSMLGVAGCAQPSKTENKDGSVDAANITWDGEYDIVVVGAGGGGLAAAAVAGEKGSKALVVEIESKQSFSNTALCGGVMMVCGTDVQKENGLEGDTVDNFKKYIAAVSGELAYIDHLNQWADNCLDAYNWVVDMGVKFPAEYLYYSGQEQSYANVADPYPRGHIAEGHIGNSITSKMEANALDKGAEIMYSTQALDLVEDADGRIIGITTDNGNFKGNKAVILACGGFSRNKDMLKNYIPDMIHGGSFGSLHQQGDGINMGLRQGAKIGNMWAVQAKCTGTYLGEDDCKCNTIYSWGNPCVMVTEEGKREIAEDTFYEKHYDFIASQPNQHTFIVWDQKVTDLGSDVLSVPPMSDGLTTETEEGVVYKADSYAELADQMGVPQETFVATMERYNQMMAAGVDEDLGRKSGLGAVDTAPFYAAKLIPAICDTAGGLVVDLDYRVLDNNDEPIPGLYAVGATSAGWRGLYYVGSGTAVSYTITTGKLAAEKILV